MTRTNTTYPVHLISMIEKVIDMENGDERDKLVEKINIAADAINSFIDEENLGYKLCLSFVHENLQGKNFSGLSSVTFYFKNCNLKNANLSSSGWTDSGIENCQLEGADFRGDDCRYCFENLSLNNANFSGTTMQCYFHDVDFAGADFSNAHLEDEFISYCKGCVNMDKATFAGAKFNDSENYPLIEYGASPMQRAMDEAVELLDEIKHYISFPRKLSGEGASMTIDIPAASDCGKQLSNRDLEDCNIEHAIKLLSPNTQTNIHSRSISGNKSYIVNVTGNLTELKQAMIDHQINFPGSGLSAGPDRKKDT